MGSLSRGVVLHDRWKDEEMIPQTTDCLNDLSKPRKPFTKGFVSWKGRAKAMEEFLVNNGFTVQYTADSVILTGYKAPEFQAKRPWWKFW